MKLPRSRGLLRCAVVAGAVGVGFTAANAQVALTLTPGVDYTKQNWANTKPIRKFVNQLPGLGAANANNLGQYIPVAQAKNNPLFPNDDYYELGLTDFFVQMNSDLPSTRIRGYYDHQQPNAKQYLGPLIIAIRNRPVRIKLTNELPNESAGDLFLPVDHTYMGMNLGPLGSAGLTIVSRLATTLTVSKVTLKLGKAGQLTAQLLAGTTPVSGKTIFFSVNGFTGSATTNAQGWASVSYTAKAKGKFTITGSFPATNDPSYLPSNGTNILTVN